MLYRGKDFPIREGESLSFLYPQTAWTMATFEGATGTLYLTWMGPVVTTCEFVPEGGGSPEYKFRSRSHIFAQDMIS